MSTILYGLPMIGARGLTNFSSGSQVVDLLGPSGHNRGSRSPLVLHVLRLLPFLVGGHRQLALENLTLLRQLAVYKRTAP